MATATAAKPSLTIIKPAKLQSAARQSLRGVD